MNTTHTAPNVGAMLVWFTEFILNYHYFNIGQENCNLKTTDPMKSYVFHVFRYSLVVDSNIGSQFN